MLLGEYRKLDPSPLEEFIFSTTPVADAITAAIEVGRPEHPGNGLGGRDGEAEFKPESRSA